MTTWQDIETAPKDGKRILVWNEGENDYWTAVFVARWGKSDIYDDIGWTTDSEGPGYNTVLEGVTHWMPLPAPPLPGESNARFIAGPATPSKR